MGFREKTRHFAEQSAVNGFVRNLADGRVELVIEGPEEQLKELVSKIESYFKANITKATINDMPCTNEFSDFSVRY